MAVVLQGKLFKIRYNFNRLRSRDPWSILSCLYIYLNENVNKKPSTCSLYTSEDHYLKVDILKFAIRADFTLSSKLNCQKCFFHNSLHVFIYKLHGQDFSSF